MRKNIKLLIAGFVFLASAYVVVQLFVPLHFDDRPVEVLIPEGTSFRQALDILIQTGLMRDKNVFIILGRLTGADRKIRAGYYSFREKMMPIQVYDLLKKGKIIEYDVTIVEGDSLAEIGEKLASFGLVSAEEFNSLSRDREFLRSLFVEAPSLEGYLFPQTYRIPKGALPQTIMRVMVQKLREEYNEKLKQRTKTMGWTEHEALTLASIIEKEAVVDTERTIISAVYHNRMKKGMPLQADPTAVYGVKSSKQKILKKDLLNKTDYNTYVIAGLPPGPIASPGLKSIVAALYPANVPYFYFVSKRDGTHHFSETLEEHLDAIRRVKAQKEQAPEQDDTVSESSEEEPQRKS